MPCCNPQALYDTFSLFGNILSCKVATDENGASKGYGYVHYETGVSANMAIAKINGMLIAGKQVLWNLHLCFYPVNTVRLGLKRTGPF